MCSLPSSFFPRSAREFILLLKRWRFYSQHELCSESPLLSGRAPRCGGAGWSHELCSENTLLSGGVGVVAREFILPLKGGGLLIQGARYFGIPILLLFPVPGEVGFFIIAILILSKFPVYLTEQCPHLSFDIPAEAGFPQQLAKPAGKQFRNIKMELFMAQDDRITHFWLVPGFPGVETGVHGKIQRKFPIVLLR